MPKHLAVRPLSGDEIAAIKRLAHSRTAAARLVERARMVWLSAQGESVAAIAAAARSGRPPTYSAGNVEAAVAAALTDPQTLGLPFGCWTYDRLTAYLNETVGVPIKRSRINEVLLAEGLRWRQQETRFGVRVDPEFAARRGR